MNGQTGEPVRIRESVLDSFVTRVFTALRVPHETAKLAARSLLDASLMGIRSHGVEALDMYVDQLCAGGLKAGNEPERIRSGATVELWDLRHGFGLAGGRIVMAAAIERAKEHGLYLATCRNANHLGACGVYAKLAADVGLIGIVTQQTLASLAPCGGREGRIGASPFAFVAPVQGSFPFCFDASMAAMTRGRINQRITAPA